MSQVSGMQQASNDPDRLVLSAYVVPGSVLRTLGLLVFLGCIKGQLLRGQMPFGFSSDFPLGCL